MLVIFCFCVLDGRHGGGVHVASAHLVQAPAVHFCTPGDRTCVYVHGRYRCRYVHRAFLHRDSIYPPCWRDGGHEGTAALPTPTHKIVHEHDGIGSVGVFAHLFPASSTTKESVMVLLSMRNSIPAVQRTNSVIFIVNRPCGRSFYRAYMPSRAYSFVAGTWRTSSA